MNLLLEHGVRVHASVEAQPRSAINSGSRVFLGPGPTMFGDTDRHAGANTDLHWLTREGHWTRTAQQ